MNLPDDITIDGDIINGTFSCRAPKIRLEPVRFMFRSGTSLFLLKVFLFFAVVGGLVFILWSKIAGVILFLPALLIAFLLWRLIGLRATEFQNAVLCPGIVIAENPPTVLVLANLTSDGSPDPVWGVKSESSKSLKPFKAIIGNRIPCAAGFLGDGLEGSWDDMVVNPLSSGTGDKAKLSEALARLDDETEWGVLEGAIERKMIPEYGKMLRL
jgi:hypothetical protein